MASTWGTSSLCLHPLLLAIKFSVRNTWACIAVGCFHKQYTLCKKNGTHKKGMERGKKVSAYKRGCWLEDHSYLFSLHDTLYMWSFLPNVGTYCVWLLFCLFCFVFLYGLPYMRKRNRLEQQSVNLSAGTFSGDGGGGGGGRVLCCVLTLQFSAPFPRLARHLQKEAQSQHNNSEFTEDQKVSVTICSVKELDSWMLTRCIVLSILQTRALWHLFFSSRSMQKHKQSPAWLKPLLSLDVTDAWLCNTESLACQSPS